MEVESRTHSPEDMRNMFMFILHEAQRIALITAQREAERKGIQMQTIGKIKQKEDLKNRVLQEKELSLSL